MVTFHRASTGDTVTVPEALAAKYDARPEWARVSQKKAAQTSTKKETAND